MSSRLRSVLFAAILLSCIAHSPAAADVYEVDTVHSSVIFGIKHSNINSIYGLFAETSGHFSIDGQGDFDVSVAVDSINSGSEGRDRHLKSPDFFSARQFPTIRFKSKQVRRNGDDTLEVKGDLTLRGVTKPITAIITTATGKGRNGEARGGIQTKFNVKRSDFKLGGPGLGDEVLVVISLQGVKK